MKMQFRRDELMILNETANCPRHKQKKYGVCRA